MIEIFLIAVPVLKRLVLFSHFVFTFFTIVAYMTTPSSPMQRIAEAIEMQQHELGTSCLNCSIVK
jgi:hypothetical protein